MEQLYLWLWIFFLYAFLGWCSEVVFAAVKTGKFVNRGYLLGPVCPIYGMGVALVLWALAPLEGNLLVLYFGSVLITSALEFLLGWISEKLLHQRLWDYSNMPFNICGHVCLAFSLVWGFACLLVVRVFHPVLMGLVALIPHLVGWILLAVFSMALLTDLILTTAAALKLPRQIRAVEDMEKLLRSISDNIGESLYSGVTKLELEERKEEFQAKMEARNAKNEALRRELEEKIAAYRASVGKNRTYHRLVKAFPHLREERHHRRLEELRAYMARRNQEKQESEEHKQ